MQIKIEIDDTELKTEMTSIIARKLTSDYSSDRNLMKRVIGEVIKEAIYSQKKEIIDMVVNRASAEIVRKAMPELINKIVKE